MYYYNKAIELNNNFAGVWKNKGVALYAIEEIRRYQNYDKSVGIDSKYDQAWYSKGIALAVIITSSLTWFCVFISQSIYLNKLMSLRI